MGSGDMEMDGPEQVAQLRLLLDSIAASPLAKQQVGIAFSLPSPNLVRNLEREYMGLFRWFLPLMSPDMDATAHILDFANRMQSVSKHLTLVTYTTLDATFHPQYFS